MEIIRYLAGSRSRVKPAAIYASLLYIEISLLMVQVSLMWGKLPALILGLTLAGLLSWHLAGLWYDKRINRIIHLYLLDIHGAWCLVLGLAALYFWMSGTSGTWLEGVLRTIYGGGEIIFVFLLSDE
jgi:hypothetical protein